MKKIILLIISISVILIINSNQITSINQAMDDDGFGYIKTFEPDDNPSYLISSLFDDDTPSYVYHTVQFDTALLNESYYMNFMYPSVISGVSNTSEFGYFFPWGLKNGFILTRHDSDSLYSEPYYRFTEVFWGNYVINYKYGDYKWKIGVCIDPTNSDYINAYSRPGQWYGELKRKPYLSEDSSITVYRDELIQVLDDIPPTIILQSGTDSSFVSGNQTLSFLAYDNAHSSYASYDINESEPWDTVFDSSSAMEPFYLTYDFDSESGTEYTVTVTVKDAWGGTGLLGNEVTKTFSFVNPIYYISNIYQDEELIGEEFILKSYEPDFGIYSNEMNNDNISNTQLYSPVTVQYIDNDNAIFFKTNLEIKYNAFPYMPKSNPEMDLLIEWNNGIKGKGNKGRTEHESINLASTILLEIFHQKDKCIIEELDDHAFTLKTKLSNKGLKYNEEEIALNSIHLVDRDSKWNNYHSLFPNVYNVPNWFNYWTQSGIFSASQLQGNVAYYDSTTATADNAYGYFSIDYTDRYFISYKLNEGVVNKMCAVSELDKDSIIRVKMIFENQVNDILYWNGIHALGFVAFHECGHMNDFNSLWSDGNYDVTRDEDHDLIPDDVEEGMGFTNVLADTDGDGIDDFEELQYQEHITRLKVIYINALFDQYDICFPGEMTKWNDMYVY